MSLTREEQAAVDAWLAANGKPQKYPTGYSAIYDDMGNRRVAPRQQTALLARNIRRLYRYDHMTHDEIAARLKVPVGDVVQSCARHGIKTKGSTR